MAPLAAVLACFCPLNLAGAPRSDGSPEPARRRVVLSEEWLVRQLETNKPDIGALAAESASKDGAWLPATMPAQVHDVLLAHDLIPDPHVGENASVSAWVGEKTWAYVCRFPSPKSVPGPAFLRFMGVDTLAEAWLNGAPLGRFENMFREYSVEVKDRLLPASQTNLLVLVFSPPLEYRRAAALPGDDPKAAPHKSLRKCHSDFSSYLGARPHAVKVGVYRDVVLDLPDQSWITDLWVRPNLARDFKSATLHVRTATASADATLRWTLRGPFGREVSHGRLTASGGGGEFAIPVEDPKLWWPRTHGPQHLYELEVVLDADGRVLDRRRTTVGIREVTPVLRDRLTGENRFRFDVNGQPVFFRGANWVPLEGATHVWDEKRARRLLDLAEHGNMNMLRIWGEGVLPPASFYEECDRRGLCLWQDFMFGFYDHAEGDTEFLENCRAEIGGTIRRLRNHPSVLLWCGGNEQYLRGSSIRVPEPKREIFERMMPALCKRLDPSRLFHTSSPHGGANGNWPLEGDWHDYTTINSTPEASVPLFGSEVLRVSTPSITSMRRFLSEEELWPEGFDPAVRTPGQPAWPPAWAYHSTGLATWDRVGPLHDYCDPASPEDLIRVIGTAHGEYLRDRVERARRGIPDGSPSQGAGAVNRRCWGNLVWRLNDSWPVIYGSVVDYYLEPKIAHYFLRRAYEPVLVSFEKTPDRLHVWVINDSPQPVSGTLRAKRLDFDGKALGKLETAVSVKPGEAKRCLDTTPLGEINLRSQFLHASFAGHEATCLLIGERYLHLPNARLVVRRAGGSIELETDAFARQATLEFEGVTGAVFEDNFFDLIPGQKRTVQVVNAAGGQKLTVRALNAEPIALEWKP
jgi:hypothetical protein